MNAKTIKRGGCLILVACMLLSSRLIAQNQTLTLKECINYTLEHNPNSKISLNSAKSAKEKIRESRADFLPSLSGNIGIDYNIKLATTVIPAGSFSPTETKMQMGNKYSNGAYLQLDQKIFDRSSFVGLKISKVNREIADLNLQKQNETLIFNTTVAYYEALTYAEKGRLLHENEKQYETTVNILKLRFDHGEVKKSEYDRARVNYSNVQFEIEANNSAYKLALNKLKNSMGLDLESQIDIKDNVEMMNVEDNSLNWNTTSFNIDNLTDFQIDNKNLELKKLDVCQKEAAFLPTLSLYGKYGGNAYGSAFFPTLGNCYDYSVVGIKVSVPLFSGFKKESQLAQSRFSLASQEQTIILNRQNYDLNIENATTNMISYWTNLKKAKENLQLAKEMMDASTVEYKEGTATLSSLLDAEYSYKEARTNYTTSLLDYLTAQLSYYKNNGTISEFINKLK